MIVCPKCREEIPSLECEVCGGVTPEAGQYCMHCGERLEKSSLENSDEFDLEGRVLCSDGTCTGIVVNGRCTECGRPQ